MEYFDQAVRDGTGGKVAILGWYDVGVHELSVDPCPILVRFCHDSVRRVSTFYAPLSLALSHHDHDQSKTLKREKILIENISHFYPCHLSSFYLPSTSTH